MPVSPHLLPSYHRIHPHRLRITTPATHALPCGNVFYHRWNSPMVGSLCHLHHYRICHLYDWCRTADFVDCRSTRLANVRLHHRRWCRMWNMSSKRVPVSPSRPPTIVPPNRKRNSHVLTNSIVPHPLNVKANFGV